MLQNAAKGKRYEIRVSGEKKNENSEININNNYRTKYRQGGGAKTKRASKKGK